ncbi:unnamed protein product [Anisakis simplex]|uniref:SGNH_hydro domain-containing protein n=1 Tax=Anisakis simplex TaxID=6269 RepID=A0A0M3J714_ANISI|nr:unnamed protein product [Anisakis simplex]
MYVLNPIITLTISFTIKSYCMIHNVCKISELSFESGPDLLLMSVGGNDIGYSEIVSTLIWGESSSLFASVDMRFFYASYQLDRIAASLHKIKPLQIVIPHYFDVTRNEKGIIDANCDELHQVHKTVFSSISFIIEAKKISEWSLV